MPSSLKELQSYTVCYGCASVLSCVLVLCRDVLSNQGWVCSERQERNSTRYWKSIRTASPFLIAAPVYQLSSFSLSIRFCFLVSMIVRWRIYISSQYGITVFKFKFRFSGESSWSNNFLIVQSNVARNTESYFIKMAVKDSSGHYAHCILCTIKCISCFIFIYAFFLDSFIGCIIILWNSTIFLIFLKLVSFLKNTWYLH